MKNKLIEDYFVIVESLFENKKQLFSQWKEPDFYR